jgi:hypothetical protein
MKIEMVKKGSEELKRRVSEYEHERGDQDRPVVPRMVPVCVQQKLSQV